MRNVIDKERLEKELMALHDYFKEYTPAEIVLICNLFVQLTAEKLTLSRVKFIKK